MGFLKKIFGSNKTDAQPQLSSAEIYFNRAYSHVDNKDFNSMISDFTKAIELDPQFADAYHRRGMILGALGNYDSAIADYNKAIELNPKYGTTYKNRGVLFLKINDRQRAIVDFEKALTLGLDPNDEEQVKATLENLR